MAIARNPHLRDQRNRVIHALTEGVIGAGGGVRQKPPAPNARHAVGNQRTNANASHRAQSSIAVLYHQIDSVNTQGVGSTPADWS